MNSNEAQNEFTYVRTVALNENEAKPKFEFSGIGGRIWP